MSSDACIKHGTHLECDFIPRHIIYDEAGTASTADLSTFLPYVASFRRVLRPDGDHLNTTEVLPRANRE
jgi:hypothetical protein